MDQEFEIVRKTLLDNLGLLNEIAGRWENRPMQKNLGAVYDTIDGLPERANQNRLPEQAIRIILNDARLDAMILLADMKVSILYAHQEALAPTEKLRAEVRANMENALRPLTGELDQLPSKEDIGQIERDLQVIHRVEQAFRLRD